MFQIQKPNIDVLDKISEENLSQTPEKALLLNKTWKVSPEEFFKSISLTSAIPSISSYYFIFATFKDNLLIYFDNEEIQFYAILPLEIKGFSEEELEAKNTYLCELSQFTILSTPKTPFHFQFEDKDVFFLTENLKHKIEIYPNKHPIVLPPSLSYIDFKIKKYLKSLLAFFSLSPSLLEEVVEIVSGNIYMNCTFFTIKIQDSSLTPPHGIILKSFYLKAIIKMEENLKIASSQENIYLRENFYTLSLPRIKTSVDINFIPDREIQFTFSLNMSSLLKAFKTALAFKSQTFGFNIEGENFYLRTSSKTEFVIPVVCKGKSSFITNLSSPLFYKILLALPKDENLSFSVTKTYIEIQVQMYTVRISRFIS